MEKEINDLEGKRNYQWTTKLTKIVWTWVENGLIPTTIMRNLQSSAISMHGLTKQQFYFKVNACNRLLTKTEAILDTGTLRERRSAQWLMIQLTWELPSLLLVRSLMIKIVKIQVLCSVDIKVASDTSWWENDSGRCNISSELGRIPSVSVWS